MMFVKNIMNQFNYFTNQISYLDAIILGFISGIFGQLGDFSESMIKREANIKDTSNILRGHGGVLDRFDSLFFVVPSFYIYILRYIKIS